eukprot:CAMPEP_0170071344 /NCGR_PEP_ID=MMETSP0019_2-20121128/9313_1 /TAXON_ID=98059 /ORGANISM="Dinobryon sp., Strain UTEXLB2267" /LENGTH=317 /DNA_ID=CAMNT_0010279883 /DNA_START=534 /DNA_END=1487 /DNA_ORIENTATION=+
MVFCTAGVTGSVSLCDSETGRLLNTIAAHRSTVQQVALNGTASLLATASATGTVIRVFSLPAGDCVHVLRHRFSHSEGPNSLTMSLAALSAAAAGSPVGCSLRFHTSQPLLIACSPAAPSAGTAAGMLNVFSLAPPQPPAADLRSYRLSEHSDGFCSVEHSGQSHSSLSSAASHSSFASSHSHAADGSSSLYNYSQLLKGALQSSTAGLQQLGVRWLSAAPPGPATLTPIYHSQVPHGLLSGSSRDPKDRALSFAVFFAEEPQSERAELRLLVLTDTAHLRSFNLPMSNGLIENKEGGLGAFLSDESFLFRPPPFAR